MVRIIRAVAGLAFFLPCKGIAYCRGRKKKGLEIVWCRRACVYALTSQRTVSPIDWSGASVVAVLAINQIKIRLSNKGANEIKVVK